MTVIPRPVVASAPGKVILFGEHAVVHGKRAVAASVSELRIVVEVTPLSTPILSIVLPDLRDETEGQPASFSTDLACLPPSLVEAIRGESWGQALPPNDETVVKLHAALDGQATELERQALLPLIFLVTAVLGKSLLDANCPVVGLKLEAFSASLPLGAGLGSSAALCVAASAALLELRAIASTPSSPTPLDPTDELRDRSQHHLPLPTAARTPPPPMLASINDWAFAAETLTHGNPSGLDNTVSCYGGMLRYVRSPRDVAPVMSFPPLDMLLTDTKVPGRSTRRLVAGVATRLARYPVVTQHLFDAIDSVAEQFLEGGGELTSEEVGHLMAINHCLLGALGVGHACLDTVCSIGVRHGCLGKMTGAGGGGCALTLLPKDLSQEGKAALEAELTEQGFKSYSSSLGGVGVLIHRDRANAPKAKGWDAAAKKRERARTLTFAVWGALGAVLVINAIRQ